MKSIDSLPMSRLHNAETYQFHNRVCAYLNTSFVTKYKLTRLFDLFWEPYKLFEEIYLSNQASTLTPEKKAADNARGNYFIGIKQAVGSFERFGTEEEKAAAVALKYVLKPYKDAMRKSMMEESGQIRSFIVDMCSSKNIGYVATLKLEDRIAELENLNEAFDDLYYAYQGDILSAKEAGKLKDARREMELACRKVFDKVNALSMIASDEGEIEEDLSDFIDNINKIIQSMHRILNAREGRNKAKEEEEEERSE